jgi:hypothetical protein
MFQEVGFGGVAERLKAAVLKTVRPERVSWVRIPPPPPFSHHLYREERELTSNHAFSPISGGIPDACRISVPFQSDEAGERRPNSLSSGREFPFKAY